MQEKDKSPVNDRNAERVSQRASLKSVGVYDRPARADAAPPSGRMLLVIAVIILTAVAIGAAVYWN